MKVVAVDGIDKGLFENVCGIFVWVRYLSRRERWFDMGSARKKYNRGGNQINCI